MEFELQLKSHPVLSRDLRPELWCSRLKRASRLRLERCASIIASALERMCRKLSSTELRPVQWLIVQDSDNHVSIIHRSQNPLTRRGLEGCRAAGAGGQIAACHVLRAEQAVEALAELGQVGACLGSLGALHGGLVQLPVALEKCRVKPSVLSTCNLPESDMCIIIMLNYQKSSRPYQCRLRQSWHPPPPPLQLRLEIPCPQGLR